MQETIAQGARRGSAREIARPLLSDELRGQVTATARKLLQYCQSRSWAGIDPYDALNSRLLAAASVLNRRSTRLAFTQLLKRSPVNLRPLLMIPGTENPKALALFLAATVHYPKLAGTEESAAIVSHLKDRIQALRSPRMPYWCWGYSFPWQTRTVLVPAAAPNLVCTTFVANALLDVYDRSGDTDCLEMGLSAAEYLLRDLFRTESAGVAGFAYPLPDASVHTHNANFLAAGLLSRAYRRTRAAEFREAALKAARYSCSRQQPDGSWMYGEGRRQQWIDNFHTGYNLGALKQLGRDLETDEFRDSVSRGFDFYRKHFFREDGAVCYYADRPYPVDSHCVAQSLITLTQFADERPDVLRVLPVVFAWTMRHLWDSRGFFYYRVHRVGTVKTPYMRWCQAWMLLALTAMLSRSEAPLK
jgi:hypothetical protein